MSNRFVTLIENIVLVLMISLVAFMTVLMVFTNAFDPIYNM